MLKSVVEIVLTYRLGATALLTSFGVNAAAFLDWMTINGQTVSITLTSTVLLITALKYICDVIRENRKSKVDIAHTEVKIERERLENEKLRRELNIQDKN